MAGRLKKIIVTILVLVASGAIVGYYQWNKPHQEVAEAEGVKIDALGLYNAFTTDSITAKKNYTQKVLEVSGAISSISKNQQNQTVLLIKTASGGAFVNCTMEGKAGAIKEGDTIVIKGICDGIGQGDADLGIMGDVYLVRCYLVK